MPDVSSGKMIACELDAIFVRCRLREQFATDQVMYTCGQGSREDRSAKGSEISDRSVHRMPHGSEIDEGIILFRLHPSPCLDSCALQFAAAGGVYFKKEEFLDSCVRWTRAKVA
jgi:hypothetical protein